MRRQTGSSLIEQTVVLFGVAALLVGLFDISKIIQGYVAVREGVASTIRCLYTADGDCRVNPADEPPRDRRVFDYQRVTPKYLYEVERFRYTALGSWVEAPEFSQQANATVLDSVSYDLPGEHYVQVANDFGDAPLRYVSRRDLRLIGTNSKEASYRYEDGSVPNGAERKTISLSSINLSLSNRSVDSPSFSLTKPNLDPNLPCLIFPDAGSPQIARHCEESWPNNWTNGHSFGSPEGATWQTSEVPIGEELSNGTFVVLQINGRSRGNGSDRSATVSIQIFEETRPNSNSWRHAYSLGGQQIENTSEQRNFYPRGAAAEWVKGLEDTSPNEFRYYQAIRLLYDRRYRVRFELESPGGTTPEIGWQGSELLIFRPRYSDSSLSINCGDPCMEQCAPQNTVLPADVVATLIRSKLDSSSNYDYGCQASAPQVDQHTFTTSSRCEPTLLKIGDCIRSSPEKSCPTNFGVSNPADRNALRGICPAESGAIAGSERWRLSKKQLASKRWAPNSCDEPSPPDPDDWKSYSALNVSAIEIIGSRAVAADPQTHFSCAGFSFREMSFSEDCRDSRGNPLGTLFGEFIPALSNPADQLRFQALLCGMPGVASFSVDSEKITTLVESAPQNESYRMIVSDVAATEIIPGGPFPEGTLPGQCRSTGSSCEALFRGFQRFVPDSHPNERQDIEIQKAVTRGSSRSKSIYPFAHICADNSATHCQTFNVEQNDDALITVRSSLRVPLTLLSLFRGDPTLNLEYSQSRRWEGEYAGQ